MLLKKPGGKKDELNSLNSLIESNWSNYGTLSDQSKSQRFSKKILQKSLDESVKETIKRQHTLANKTAIEKFN